jgi:CRP-like cAMP-binding protein
MSVESLIGYLSAITKLSTAFIGELRSGLDQEQYKPHQIIHAAGQVENRLWYIETGFARSYYFDQSGKEHTLSFYLENEIIFSYKGFWREATDYYLEVLTPTNLISLPYESLYRLMEQHAETRTLIDVFTRQRYYQELFKSRLMTWTAAERYYQFRKANPDIFKLASIRLIASFLNMTRENLSRLMGRET